MNILGIGNALVDSILELKEDRILVELGLPKGSMQLIDSDKLKSIMERTSGFKALLAAGGSASNTITSLAHLGVKTGFIGKIGKDESGQFYKNDMQTRGVVPNLLEGDLPSGTAIAFVSADGERTFATYLGAAATLAPEDLTPEMFAGYTIFHVEGYLVQSYALIEKAMKFAKDAGCYVSIDLASYNVVEDHHAFMHRLVENYVDIVFANEEESKAFTGKEPLEALKEIAQMAKIAIVKTGSKGALAMCRGELATVPAIPATCVDTNGAGDAFAAGFLYGITQNVSLATCATMGTVLAGNVVEVTGPKMDTLRWMKIEQMLQPILLADPNRELQKNILGDE
ncbi:MAG: adenosine kinase [Bacteroidales bacterium]|nr:adenosine kinase [Bacteroidales bacterium]